MRSPRALTGMALVLAVAAGAQAQVRTGPGPVRRPIPSGGSAAMQPSGLRYPLQLPVPTSLASATDPTVCSAHGGLGGGLACKALLPKGDLALVWTYPAMAQISGFHVYRVDGGGRTLVATQANGAAATIYIVDPPPADGYANACYAVTAFSPTDESGLSPPFCGGQARLMQTLTLSPTNLRSINRSHGKDENFIAGGAATNDKPSGSPDVGYSHQTRKFTFGDMSSNVIYRLGLLFDLSSVHSRNIVSARLGLETEASWTGAADPEHSAASDHSTSCAAVVAVGTAKWWKYTDWIGAAAVLRPGPSQGPDVSIDVTSIVRQWASSPEDANQGIVLLGEDENLDAFTESTCVTAYVPSSIKLTVIYN